MSLEPTTSGGGLLELRAENLRLTAQLTPEELRELRSQIDAALPAPDSKAPAESDFEPNVPRLSAPMPSPPRKRHVILSDAHSRQDSAPIRSGLYGPGGALEFSRSAYDFITRQAVELGDLEAGFAAGGDEWLSPRQTGDSPVYVRALGDEWAAAFFKPEPPATVPYVVSVMPLDRAYDERRRAGTPHAGRRSAGSAARTRSKPTTAREFHQLLRDHGFHLAYTGADHVRVTHPEAGGSLTVSNTPSDNRSILNELARVRRQFPGRID